MGRTGPVTKDTSTIALGLAQIRVGKSAAHIASSGPALGADASIGALANTKYSGEVSYWKLESGFPLLEDMSLPLRETSSLECSFKEMSAKNLALARGLDVYSDVAATANVVSTTSAAGTLVGEIAVDNDGGVVTDTFTVVVEGESTGTTTYSVYGAVSGKVLSSVSDDTLQAAANGANPYFTIPSGFFDGVWVEGETVVFRTSAFVTGTDAFGDNHAGRINLGAIKAPDYVRMEAVYTYPNNVNHMYIIFPRANVVSSIEVDMQAENAATVPMTFEAKRADSEVAGGDAVWDIAPLGCILFD